MIYVSPRCEDIPAPPLHLRERGRCELCEYETWMNKEAYKDSQFRKQDPHIVCTVCYTQGKHLAMSG